MCLYIYEQFEAQRRSPDFFFFPKDFIPPPQGETLQRAQVFMRDVRQVLGGMDKPRVDFLKYNLKKRAPSTCVLALSNEKKKKMLFF